MIDNASLINNWIEGIDSEYIFWKNYITTKKNEFKNFTYGHFYTNDLFNDKTKTFKVLDVAAGPQALLPCRFAHENIEVHACDALAYLYKDIFKNSELSMERELEFSLMETLSSKYEENYFDLVIIRNALDHAIDPIESIYEMLKITKKNGEIFLYHYENEATKTEYEGFHQHDFYLNENQEFIIKNNFATTNINELLKEFALIENEKAGIGARPIITTKIKKLEDPCNSQKNFNHLYLELFFEKISKNILQKENPNIINIDETKTFLDHINSTGFQERYKEFINKNKNKKFMLYGAGIFARTFLQNVNTSDLNIIGIIDRDTNIKNTNYKIFSPLESKDVDFDILLVSMFDSKTCIKNLIEIQNNYPKKIETFLLGK